MKIKKKPNTNIVQFKHMKCGDVFSYAGIPYQRTENLFSGNRTALNVIRLSNGLAAYLSDDMYVVQHHEAELTINE